MKERERERMRKRIRFGNKEKCYVETEKKNVKN